MAHQHQTLAGSNMGCNVQLKAYCYRTGNGSKHAAWHACQPGPTAVAAAAPTCATQHNSLLLRPAAACSSAVTRPPPCRVSGHANGACAAVAVEASVQHQIEQQQQEDLQLPYAPDTYSMLQALHNLCDDSSSLAAPAQLHAWAAAAQPHLPAMALSEITYVASCLLHYQYLLAQQQHQQQQGSQGQHTGVFVVSPSFLQQACAAACAAATLAQQGLQHSSGSNAHQQHQQQQQEEEQEDVGQQQQYSQQALQEQHSLFADPSAASVAAAADHYELTGCLQQLIDLLQWAAAEVVQQRQLLQQQLLHMQQAQQQQQRQNASAPFPVAPVALQAHRQQLQQQVEAQQQVQALMQHPLLLQALPHANCWQLQQLLLCCGQLGQRPAFDWMGHWLAAARHATSDLALPFQQQEWRHRYHLQQQHGPQWHLHLQEHRVSAAAAYAQLVGLLSGLAAAHVKPPMAWTNSWQQAATAVLAAQPCFGSLDQHGSGAGSSSGFFHMLQQLLQSVSTMGLRLTDEFWVPHEGLVQSEVLGFGPAELLRLVQLHQQVHLKPSKSCIKYISAVLEQHISAQHAALQQEQQPHVPGSNSASTSSSTLAVMQLVMCLCGLGVWGVRLHLRSVAELLVLLEAHKQQLPLAVVLQVLSVLGTRMARVYSLGSAGGACSYSSDSSSSGSYSSGSYSSGASMSSLSIDGGEDATSATARPPLAAPAAAPVAAPVAAAAIEHLLLYAAEQLAPSYAAAATAAAAAEHASIAGSSGRAMQHQSSDSTSLLKLLQISATLARNCARASNGSAGRSFSLTDSVTTLAAATAAGDAEGSSGVALVDRLVHKLHPLCAAVAPECSAQQLVALMTAWSQLGFSTAWRFGGFRRGYKRLGQTAVLQMLSGADLAAAVEVLSKLPPTQAVVAAVAAEVLRRQQQPDQQPNQQQQLQGNTGAADESTGPSVYASSAAVEDPATAHAGRALGARASRLSPAQLLSVVCSVPGLSAMWPAHVTLQLLLELQGVVTVSLNPSQQWRLWNALQQLQQQWKPAVVASAAAAAAAAGSSTGAVSTADKAAAAAVPSADVHPTVTFAAAAAAASLKAVPAEQRTREVCTTVSSSSRQVDVSTATTTTSSSSSSGIEASTAAASSSSSSSSIAGTARGLPRPTLPTPAPVPTSTTSEPVVQQQAEQQPQQQQLMRLLDELQDEVAAALARVQPDPDALPLEAAPPKGPRQLSGQQVKARFLQEDAKRTEQQLLAGFAKAQKSLLDPHCSGVVLVKVLEGLVLLLAVPCYAKAAHNNDTVRRAVLRALEAAAWTDLLAQSLDIQQLLLLTSAARSLGALPDGPYLQLLQQETSRVLAEVPLRFLASGLGRVAQLRLPEFKSEVSLLKFWVGRLAQAARDSPEYALAVLVPLSQLGFRPGAGAAGLVLQPLLGAAAAAADAYALVRSSDGEPSEAAAALSPTSVVALTKVLAAMSLRPEPGSAQQLLQAHIGLMRHFSVAQLLQLGRDVMGLDLLTVAMPPTAASAARRDASSNGSSGAGVTAAARPEASSSSGSSDSEVQGRWLVPGAGAWVLAWQKQLLKRDAAQMDVAQVVDLQLLLCDLDLTPWHLSPSHAAHIHACSQQLQAKLAALPSWQGPLAAAVQANYHSTQELRRLVAARARRLAHQQGVAVGNSSIGGMGSGTAAAAGAAAQSLGSIQAAVAAAMQMGSSSSSTAADSTSSSAADGTSSGSSSGSDTYTGEAYSGTRRFVSRKAAAAVAAAAASASGMPGQSAGGFSYPTNPINHQLQQLQHQKRLLLWAAVKHQVVAPLTPAWVESCCFNVILGGYIVTPVVASGLLGAVAQVRTTSSTVTSSTVSSCTSSSSSTVTSSTGSTISSTSSGEGRTAASISTSVEAVMREQALVNLTGELVKRLLGGLSVLKGALFVQTLASFASAGVTSAQHGTARAASPAIGADAAIAAAAPAPAETVSGTGEVPATQPSAAAALGADCSGLFELSAAQQQQLLSDVARVLPLLQPSQLPLLVGSVVRLQLQPDAAWLSDALQALAVKAAAAAAAGQPAQQLLLLAAAKQLLLCGGVLLASSAPPATAAAGAAVGANETTPATEGVYGGVAAGVPGSAEGASPVAYAFRALAAGAAQILGSMFKRSQVHQESGSVSSSSPVQAAGSTSNAAAGNSPALFPYTSAMSEPAATNEGSVALLLSSLATQLQLAQSSFPVDIETVVLTQQAVSAAKAAALFRELQARRAAVENRRSDSPQPRQEGLAADTQQQQMVLAAAVLLHAGAGASGSTLSVSDSASGGAGSGGNVGREGPTLRVMTRGSEGQQEWQGSAWHGLNSRQRKRQEARQQQQQRALLGQLLQLQLQKASEQLVQAVWGSNAADTTTTSQQSFTGPADGIPATSPAPASASAYATQVLLDPTGQLLAPQTAQQQQQQGEGQQVQGSEGRSSGLRSNSSSSRSGSPPHRLATQGLQVQFDGLLRKAFMAAAAAAGSQQQRNSPSAVDGNAAAAAAGSAAQRSAGQREPWWLLGGPRDASALVQATPPDEGLTNSSSSSSSLAGSSSGLTPDSLGLDAPAGGVDGGSRGSAESPAEQVLVLPMLSRALDAQFARLMREVLHSSLAAGGGGQGRR